MNYTEAYNKIIDAYFKDEIKPFDSNFCFCGTLHGNRKWNNSHLNPPEHNYSYQQYKDMEWALFSGSTAGRWTNSLFSLSDRMGTLKYEEYLFKGMSAALEVLKKIHIRRGEDIDNQFIPEFKKRELACQS